MLNDSRSVLDDGGERATLAIGSFRLDVDTVTLYRGNDPLPVGRRAVALLSALAKRQGLVVSKDELIQAAWSGLVVEESNLSVQIAALRKALAAEPGGARWIETLPRRGYRFVGPTTASSHHSAIDEEKASPAQGVRLAILSPGAAGGRSQEGSAIARRSRWLVGRNGPLATLDKVTQRMLAGDRQVVFITGEAGIGKSSFIEMAMEQLSRYRVETLCGFCTERFGINETFLPLIDSLTTRCRGSDGSSVLEAVRAHAPTWLLQMPSFLDVADRAAFRNEVFGATRERMSREFCDLVEALSVDRPWVLVIEDMHWSDFQTVDVLSRFAHGDRQAQVLVLATYRVGDSIMSGHPVRRLHQDLEIHGRCSELQLDRLSKTEVEHHLALRFQDEKLASALSGPMFARTQGQPLFIASLVDYLVNHESIVEIDGAWRIGSGTALSEDVVPKDLINMITHRIDRLSEDEQQLLEAASVAGSECAAALVAAGLSRDTVETEEVLEGLARKNHTLVSSGVSEWPDGTYSGSYAFHHILYQNVLYQRLTPARRLQIHQRMGERLEQGYAGRTENIASTLALHFEQSRDFPRALRYLSQAAENSAKRLGHEEATNYLSRALGILDRLGTTDQYGPRTNLLRQRSWARRSTGDLAGSVRDLEEMIACAADAGQLRHEVNGLLAVSRFCLHADRRMCLHASSEALAKSEALEDDAFKALVQGSSASINLWLKGWQEQDAALCEKALHVTADARDHGTLIRRYGIEGILECLRSRYEECRRSGTDGKKLAQEVGDVYIFVLFNVMESTALIHLGQWRRLQREAVAALALAERNANRPAIALCRLTLAWLHVEAMDFYGARDLCEGVDQAVLEDNPFAFFFQRAVLAKAFVGLNEPQRARQQFDDVMQRLDSDGIMMDYTIYAQLHHCLCEYSLQVGDIAQARTSATKLYEYVAPAPDRNHLAQAHGLLTRVALAAGDLEEARAELSRALSTLGDADMPLAAWRVYRAGIEVCESLGEPTEAARYRARFEDVIRTLAGNFEPDDRLRSSLLAALDAPGRAEPAASGG